MSSGNFSKWFYVLALIGLAAGGTIPMIPKNSTRALRMNYSQEAHPFWWRQQFCIGQPNGWFGKIFIA
jgi:hypothetical protein